MKQPTRFQKFIEWLFSPRYNCAKNKHRWGYCLSDSGRVYEYDYQVPKDMWVCLDCKVKRF